MKPAHFIFNLMLDASVLLLLICSENSFAQSEIWGISHDGGHFNGGAIYKTDANGENPTIEHSFEPSGSSPMYTHLTEASNGKLYGMTYSNGTDGGLIRGMVFSIEPGILTYQLIHEFTYQYSPSFYDGSSPTGSLLLASNGMLYGMTNKGGWDDGGVAFRIDPSTNKFNELFSFYGAFGYAPFGS